MKWAVTSKHVRTSDDGRFVLRRSGTQWDIIDTHCPRLPYRGTRRTLTQAKASAEWFAKNTPSREPH